MAYASTVLPRDVTARAASDLPQKNRSGPLKHLLTAADISIDDVDYYCRTADAFERDLASSQRVAGKTRNNFV